MDRKLRIILLAIALACAAWSVQGSCPGDRCEGPVLYQFNSDNCAPGTVSGVEEMMDRRISAQGAGTCINDTALGRNYVRWTCDKAGFRQADFATSSCSNVALVDHLYEVGVCLNTSALTATVSSQLIVCSSHDRLPTSPLPVSAPSSAPVISEVPVRCQGPEDCPAMAFMEFFKDAQCSQALSTIPMAPSHTLDGAPLQSGVCYLQAPEGDPYINAVYKCAPGIYSQYYFTGGCNSTPYASVTIQTGVCIPANPGVYIKYGCKLATRLAKA